MVRLIHFLELLVLYELFAGVARFRGVKLAYWYVGGWLVALATILATSDAWATGSDWLAAFLVALPTYRIFDVLRWYADLLLDRAHHTVVSEERNLLFAVANLAETSLILAIWLREFGGSATAGSAAFDGFALVAQLAIPAAHTVSAKVAIAVAEITALLVLLTGVATLIAEIFQVKLRRTGVWEGSSRWGGGE